MGSVRGWGIAVVSAVVAALLSGGAAAPSAAAGSDCAPQDASQLQVRGMKWTPSSIVIGSRAEPATARVDMFLTDPCVLREAQGWAGQESDPNKPQVNLSYRGGLNDVEDWADSITIEPYRLNNSQAGTWNVSRMIIENRVGGSIDVSGPSFTLKRSSKITNNASPEPVRKGATITIAGSLSRISWNDWANHGYGAQPVELQFRTLTGSYTPVRTLTTGATGSVTTKVTAAQDGCFRYVFKGSADTAPATGVGDCVDVT